MSSLSFDINSIDPQDDLNVIESQSRNSFTQDLALSSDTTARPTKRRRVEQRKNKALGTLRLVSTFIDVEAQDTDAEFEDDDDNEDQGPSDFIDDAVVSTSCQRVNLRTLSSRSCSAAPEEIVQGIHARAKARGLDCNEPSLHPQWGGLAPMYIVSTPPSILSRLIPYLKKLHGTRRVLRSPDKRSIIYVETTNLIALTNAINEWPELNGWPDLDCRRPERPVLMSLNEQQNIIRRLRDKESAHKTVDLLAYRWVRALDTSSAYNLDLVFVLSEDEYPSSWVISQGSVTGLIVPRVDYRQPITQSHRTPAALFDPESIKHAYPDNKPAWNEEEEVWKWSDSTFTASGLLLVTLTRDKKLVVDGVQPTDEELALFLSSGEPILDRPALTQSCALHPGDLVIINAPDISCQYSTHNKKVGYLIDIITQRSGGCFATVESRSRSNITAGLQLFEVPVGLVKHHLLATHRNLSIGDRVCIVAGPELGTSGRIVDFIGDNEIRVLLSMSEIAVTVSVDKRHVRHDWRLGDVVEIVRGTYRGLVAFIVGILPGGGATVYSKKNHNDTGSETSAFNVRTADLQFALTRITGIRDIPSNFRPNLQSAVQYTQDRQRDAWEQDMRQTGNLLRHMEVLFVGQHPDKGMHGSIVDYHPFSRSEIGTSAAQEGTGSMETLVEQAELTLKIDITSRVSKAYASQVIERHSFLPIATAALFKSLKILHIFSMQEKPISEPEIPSEDNDCLWGIPFSSAVASHQHSKRSTPDISETTGRWLAHPNFVGKRIDVCVVPMQELTDIARRYPKLVSDGRINKTTYDRADAQKPGFLQPLNAKQQVRLKGLEWRRVKVKFPLGKDASMPVVTLRPCRTTYDGFHKETNKCISTAQGRVIIIGPDVDGYDGNIGEYAQTEPDADQLPSTFVNVKFARTRTDGRQIEQRHGRYHLHSLCRATNAPLPGFELICPPTDFEMDLSI